MGPASPSTTPAAGGTPDLAVRDFSGKSPTVTAPRPLRCHETVTALAWRPGPPPTSPAAAATARSRSGTPPPDSPRAVYDRYVPWTT
ncbi:hypothetical protein [Streptomyces lincolnensis]|uniref:hypothetical protein n=1 Tax=Streptomyces lincolnensis TaxID=1915 RepID=UPI0037D18B0D